MKPWPLKNGPPKNRHQRAGKDGDAINAVLAAVGHSFRRLLTRLNFKRARDCRIMPR
jgi:hypothetical protein